MLLPQSGGAGGRGGGIEEGYTYDDEKPYCADNARSGIYDGDYCEGFGASYAACCNEGGSPGDAYDNDDNVSFLPGSGGGAGAGFPGGGGGNGGASILLYSTDMTLNGAVKANGGDGYFGSGSGSMAGGGGGSGGSLGITACTVTTGSSASLQAKGGRGGASLSGGAGKTGKTIFPVHLFTNSYSSSFSLSLSQ